MPSPTYLSALLATSLSLFSLLGCQHHPSEPNTFVILVDKTVSTGGPKNASYHDYFLHFVLPSLTPGATVVIEPIVGKKTGSDPTLRITATLPSVTPLKKDVLYYLLKGDLSRDHACLDRVTAELRTFSQARSAFATEAESVFRSKSISQTTFLLDGVDEASESLEQRKGPGIFVLLSDGLEDSEAQRGRFNFAERTFWAKQTPATLVRVLAPNHSDPGLRGTRVYLDGLAAGDGQTYAKLREFWTDFFRTAGAETIAIGHQPRYAEPSYDPSPEALCR